MNCYDSYVPCTFPSVTKPWLKYYDECVCDIEVPDKTVYEVFADSATRYSDMLAIDYLGTKVTYEELKLRIDKAAWSFCALGVQPGDIVSLVTANTPENTIAFYALNKIGAIANMVDLTLKGSDLADKLVDSNTVVVTDSFLNEFEAVLDSTKIKNVIVASPVESLPLTKRLLYRISAPHAKRFHGCMTWKNFEHLGGSRACEIPHRHGKDDVACIFYTSGTTGAPKGAMLSNECLTSMAVEYANCGLIFSSGDRMFNENPPFISYSMVLGINLPLALGMCIVMLPTYEPDRFARRVYDAKAQHVLACPADWSNFFVDEDVAGRDYSFLSTLASGGIAFNPDTKRELNELFRSLGCKASIVEGYGMTEGSSAMCTAVPAYNVAETVGIPLPLVDVCIWDVEANCELGFGETGEICFSGPTLMKGYRGNEGATADALRAHLDGKTWLHTGDLGRIREDGGIEVVGRIKRMIIRYDGFKISPYEIEGHIRSCGGVTDCCVVATDDLEHGFGSVPAAFLVLDDGTDAERAMDAVKLVCERSLSSRNMPKAFVLIGSLPLTKVGKVDYRKLEELAVDLRVEGRGAE